MDDSDDSCVNSCATLLCEILFDCIWNACIECCCTNKPTQPNTSQTTSISNSKCIKFNSKRTS